MTQVMNSNEIMVANEKTFEVFELLDNIWKDNGGDNYAKLVIYEESFELINKYLEHDFTDDELEELTYIWLER